ncbi:hypothetical protein E2C01_093524 [Portunus trituberculatus]|uniref:Uncharacterized protein n=1 Tax=Portunus trituberculatus TaxID=210409 RepID=A0A5B7JJD7_PORTR|nr:hypothetical protein [Portunus trituberculatus]
MEHADQQDKMRENEDEKGKVGKGEKIMKGLGDSREELQTKMQNMTLVRSVRSPSPSWFFLSSPLLSLVENVYVCASFLGVKM